ncbi:hypothetical protein RIF29_19041 [Crotalaria pallida]|uniref:Uncharacterized protein n=1 Tax=Crotalaria pallida TaxID=3830 RepID=A0AAN9EZB0_CROPI
MPETPWSSKSSLSIATPLSDSLQGKVDPFNPPFSIPSFIHQQEEEEEEEPKLGPDAIDPPPKSNLCGGVAPYLITDSIRPRLIRLCNLTLDMFHSDNPGANYVFENIVKTTTTATSGTTYYITFDARAVAASTCQTFQAHVWDSVLS